MSFQLNCFVSQPNSLLQSQEKWKSPKKRKNQFNRSSPIIDREEQRGRKRRHCSTAHHAYSGNLYLISFASEHLVNLFFSKLAGGDCQNIENAEKDQSRPAAN